MKIKIPKQFKNIPKKPKTKANRELKSKNKEIFAQQPKINFQFLFPKNKRFITEVFSVSFLVFFLTFTVLIVSFFITIKLLKKLKINLNNRRFLREKILKNNKQILQYSNFKRLYEKSVLLSLQSGNTSLARSNLKKALNLDPNDKELLKLKSLTGN